VHWWQDRYGYLREWVLCALFLLLIVGIGVGIWWGLGYVTRNQCTAPYHLVYTGTRLEPIGKVLANVDQYACEAN
jgi:hypothetical protein